jgi:hypothetical protein
MLGGEKLVVEQPVTRIAIIDTEIGLMIFIRVPLFTSGLSDRKYC